MRLGFVNTCTMHTSCSHNAASSTDNVIQRHTYYKQEKAIRSVNLLLVLKVPITS